MVIFLQLTVGEIVAGGAAAVEGSLETGDQLISIDDTQVDTLKHNQVIISSNFKFFCTKIYIFNQLNRLTFC